MRLLNRSWLEFFLVLAILIETWFFATFAIYHEQYISDLEKENSRLKINLEREGNEKWNCDGGRHSDPRAEKSE